MNGASHPLSAPTDIVKVQLAVGGDGKGKEILVYNEDRSWMWQGKPTGSEVRDLYKTLKDNDNKIYCHMHQEPDGHLEMDGRADDQDW